MTESVLSGHVMVLRSHHFVKPARGVASMPNDNQAKALPPRTRLWRLPLFRLLAINLAAGAAVTVLLVGGLLLLNPGGLRDLIFADRSPAVALGLLLFSFFVTLGSTAMGTAIMAAGQREENGGPRGSGKLVTERLRRKDSPAG
jgi:hypothetical protein